MASILGTLAHIAMGLVGGCFGAIATLRYARSHEERRFIVCISAFLAISVVLLLIVTHVATVYLPPPWPSTCLVVLLVSVVTLARSNERLNEIEARATPHRTAENDQLRSLKWNQVIGAAGGNLGAASWILLVVSKTSDWFALSIVVTATGILSTRLAIRFVRHPAVSDRSRMQWMASSLIALGGISLSVIYLRLPMWQALTPRDVMTILAVNYAAIVIGIIVLISRIVSHAYASRC